MKNYIKPEFMLTSLTSNGMTGGNCSIQKEDKDLIMDVLGDDFAQAFESLEVCGMEFEGYCKFSFTSPTEGGLAKAFFS